jgi:hypothetical protein
VEVEYDFGTYPLTCATDFNIKDPKHLIVVLQNMYRDFLSEYIICAPNGEMWERSSKNGVVYDTPDYEHAFCKEKGAIGLKNHLYHLCNAEHVDTCIFCKYDYCFNLMNYKESLLLFSKCVEALAGKNAKTIFGDIQGNNGGKTLDKSLVCFSNAYFDIITRTFIPIDQISIYGRIAVCNQSKKTIDDSLINSDPKSENYYDTYKHLIPVFRSCVGQKDSLVKCLLADIGSGFLPRGIHDHYQKGTFLLGPGGRGKSEFQKIIRIIHGPANCVTPCMMTLGQKFSHGQFAGSLAVAYLPDEISKKCGLSQQMLYNFIDQTPIRCEIKFKQQLVTLPFQLYICWVANQFFNDFDVSEALLRRIIVVDYEELEFIKMDRTPSSIVEDYEV